MFKDIDDLRIGILNESQFKMLISKMGIIHQEEEIDFLLG
jgi:hypothetical protein